MVSAENFMAICCQNVCLNLTLIAVILSVSCFGELFADRIVEDNIAAYRERVVRMFQHAYSGYLKHAYPLDELRPLTCDGHDTWGSYSLTLIDALDTLAVMGNYSEFRRVAKLLSETLNFDRDINVSVFETNIRVVGGLLSAHLLSYKAGCLLEPGWPCVGPLLRLAETVARKLLPAFNTSTGMPYGTVNLRHGVPSGETSVTCTAGVGTFIVEFGALSRLTGDPVFERAALRAIRGLHSTRSSIGLLGNHIDVATGKWTAQDSGIGAGIDSYFEYLVKGTILFDHTELIEMFHEYRAALEMYAKRDDWFLWAQMQKGSITQPVFQSLDAYWPGLLSLIGEVDDAMKTYLNYHQVWRQFGFMPEFYNIPQADVQTGRESYPLRPEFIESTMYLYRATGDPYLLNVAIDVLESIEHSTRTPCGYATVKNVKDHQLDNRMESFFLAETTKYLYLMFDPDNFIHNTGGHGTVITRPEGQCIIDAGGYVFNTEAHPIDPAALYCCSVDKQQHDSELDDLHSNLDILAIMGFGPFESGSKLRLKRKKNPIASEASSTEDSSETILRSGPDDKTDDQTEADDNVENKNDSQNDHDEEEMESEEKEFMSWKAEEWENDAEVEHEQELDPEIAVEEEQQEGEGQAEEWVEGEVDELKGDSGRGEQKTSESLSDDQRSTFHPCKKTEVRSNPESTTGVSGDLPHEPETPRNMVQLTDSVGVLNIDKNLDCSENQESATMQDIEAGTNKLNTEEFAVEKITDSAKEKNTATDIATDVEVPTGVTMDNDYGKDIESAKDSTNKTDSAAGDHTNETDGIQNSDVVINADDTVGNEDGATNTSKSVGNSSEQDEAVDAATREWVKRLKRLDRIMSCPARPFHARFALMGEVFLTAKNP